MSSQTRLKHKLNRKLKLKTAKFMIITDENKQTRDVVGSVKFKETDEKRNSKKNVKKIIASKASGEKVEAKENNILRKNIYVSRSSNLKRKVQSYGTPRSRPSSHNFKYAVESTQASKERRITKNKKEQLQNRESISMDVESTQASKERRITKNKKEQLQNRESISMDVGQSGSSKPLTKRKTTLGRCLDIYQQKSPDFPPKRQVSNKKKEDKDFGSLDDKPKKKKRVIRLDPRDISNKRLDDGIIANENMDSKNIDFAKKNEMSMNAEFRAIQPSASIISFVEDNLLGRRRSIELQRAGYNTDLSAPLDNIPFSTSKERERTEENIFRNKLTFFAAAKVSSSFPPPELPEVAFAGRSNVGKSSMLNALTRQWGVARTSDKPGLTQTINFFNLGAKLNLVDLPGYGFAYAKEEVKESWEELVKEYVSTRVCLKRVCLLIDTKWGMKPRDHELIDLMERSQTKYQIVLTKTDVVFPGDVARRAMQIEEKLKRHKSVVEPVMMVSSKSGAGIRSLRTVLAKISRFAKI